MRYFRIANNITEQGLWYDRKGGFTGLIHNELSFCMNNELKMDYDPEIVGYLSAADSLEGLFHWFSREDILELQKRGYFIYEYEATDVKWYDRFKHWVISQETSVVIRTIVLE